MGAKASQVKNWYDSGNQCRKDLKAARNKITEIETSNEAVSTKLREFKSKVEKLQNDLKSCEANKQRVVIATQQLHKEKIKELNIEHEKEKSDLSIRLGNLTQLQDILQINQKAEIYIKQLRNQLKHAERVLVNCEKQRRKLDTSRRLSI